MIPLIPIIGGILGAMIIASTGDDDDSREDANDFAERMAAARERKRREREAEERRKKARLAEEERCLSRARARHQDRISSAKSAAARSKARLDELVALDNDLDNL